METRKTITKDLCPKKPDRKLLDIGDTVVTVEVVVTTEKPIVSSKFDRCLKAAEAEVDRYQKTIQDTVNKLESKIKQAKDVRVMQQMANDTTTSVKGAVRSMQSAVQVAVKNKLKMEAQGDRNLTEARVVAVVKGIFGVIKIAKDAAEVAVTLGADISAWYSLAKDCTGLAGMIYDLCKGEEPLRKELLNAIGVMTTDKQRQVIEHQRATKSTSSQIKSIFKDIYRKYKPKATAAEAVRKKYRNHVTKMRQNIDNLFTKVDSLDSKLRQAKNLKEGVQIGAKLMTMKSKGREVKAAFEKAEQFSNDMAFLMTEAGVNVDDRTIGQKISQFAGIGDVKQAATEIKSAADDVNSIIKNI